MTIVVQVSDFRNNMAMYLGKLGEGCEIELKKGKKYEAKLVPHPKKNTISNISAFLADVAKLQKKYPFNGGKDLSVNIDKILYEK